MSNSLNDQLSRMKALMTYGSVNEDAKPISNYTLEYKAKAADGKFYGIIRENSKYFVKVAAPGKETIAEAYQYIGGITNKANYEYNSYANALKQFELKLGSINEAYDENRVVVEALDPFKKEDLVIEATDKMKAELARQRQIMRNASVIMNEATEIGSTPFKTQPEAEHEHSGDQDYPFTKEGKPEADRGAIKFGEGDPEKHSSTFGPDSNDVEDYNLDKGDTPKVKDSVASESPKGGKVARVDEGVEECGGPMKECGTFCEEGDEDLELGQEDEPIDTDELVPAEDGEMGEEEPMGGEEPMDGEEPLGDEMEDDDELDFGDEEEDEFADDEDEDEFADDEDFEDNEFADEDEDEFGDEEFEDEEGDEFGDEEEFDDEMGDEDFEDEEGDEFENEEGDEFEDEEDPEIELDENVVKKFRKLVRESINDLMGMYDGKDGPTNEPDYDDEDEEEFDEPSAADLGYGSSKSDFWKEYGHEQPGRHYSGPDVSDELEESKAHKMNQIVESVVNDILNEDELHVFGDHPGYRKKPMTLPQTGEDKFQVNRDWNDDSVHSEEPFGKGKGDSTPFDELVGQITDSVMKQINENNKKKAK